MRIYKTGLLVGLTFLATSSFAQYYGSIFDAPDYSYYSEIDRDREIKKAQKQKDKDERDARREQEKQEKEQRRRDAKVHYEPKGPTETQMVLNYENHVVTADQIADAMIAKQSAAPPVKVPDQKKSYLLITVGDDHAYYKDGLFYEDNGGEMKKISAPVDALVMKIPADAKTVEKDGTKYTVYQDSCFQKVMMGGQVAYKVVANPGV